MSTKTLLIAGIVAVVVIAAAAVLVLSLDEQETHISEGVIYDGNGGTSDGKSTVESVATNVLPGGLFTKDGADFESWNTKKDGSGITYTPGDMIDYGSGKTVTLYAIWYEGKYLNITGYSSSTDYSILYDGKALGLGSIKLPSSGEMVITAKLDVTGGQFFIDKDCVQYKVIDTAKVRVYYVKFTIEGDTGHTYSINDGYVELKISFDGTKDLSLTYNANKSTPYKGIDYLGADGKTADGTTLIVEETYTISENKFILEGKTFVSWNTQKDGSGTTYKPGDKVDYYGCLVLYAQWA